MKLSHKLESDGAKIHRSDGPLTVKLEYRAFGGAPYPFVGAEYPAENAGGFVSVTGRELDEYQAMLELDPDAPGQFLEVGPGLGAVIPYLADRAKKGEIPVPIAIDSADIAGIREMLAYAIDRAALLEISDDTRERAKRLLTRCDLLLTSPHVRFHNMPLGNALAAYPDLAASADHLVELYSASFYSSVEGSTRMEIRKTLKTLVRDGGTYHRHYAQ